jgi:serine/threonine-protein kinase
VTPQRWAQARQIFEAAIAKPEAERATFLDFSCTDDTGLRAEVAQMLAAYAEPSLRSPVASLLPAELLPGDVVAHYRIEDKLGEGGMGVVYRATDTRLRRSVALKFVNSPFGDRSQHEARAVAALNHPNICILHDVGSNYLVMELIEGPTLAERIAKGPIPIHEGLDIARQIAGALEAAHEKGIVHRDLKPANVKLTAGNHVKVLDFGLAKTLLLAPEASPEDSPTVTGTQPGTILGTPAYMSPEQVVGKPLDKRTDIWSFGVVLWEMLTRRRLFEGETVTDTLAGVLRAPIDLGGLPREMPPAARELLGRCLDREPKNRLRDIGEARIALEKSSNRAVAGPQRAAAANGGRWMLVAPVLVAIAAASAALYLTRPVAFDLSNYKFTPIATDADPESLASWSPDGKSIAYLKTIEGRRQVMVRNLIAPSPMALTKFPEGVHASAPFFARDGEQLYFIAGNSPIAGNTSMPQSLWAVAVLGGDPRRVLSVDPPGQILAATISPDGKTLALWEVYEEAGKRYRNIFISSPPGAPPREYKPAPFRAEGAYIPNYLRFSPDGSRLVLSSSATLGEEWMWIIPWPDGSNSQPHRIFARGLTSPAADFDWTPDSRYLCLASGGNLYLADTRRQELQQITASASEPAEHPAVSPDGRRIIFTTGVLNYDIVEVPFDGSPPRPLVATDRTEKEPSWSAAGDQMAFITDRSGESEIWLRSSDGRWERPLVRQNDFPNDPQSEFQSASLSPDGSRVAYIRKGRLWVSPSSGGKPTVAVVGGTQEFGGPSWSPDGSSLVYMLTVNGQYQVAVARVGSGQPSSLLPGMAGQCKSEPVWSPDGRWIACGGPDNTVLLVSPDGAQKRSLPSPVRAFYDGFLLVWSRDAATIYVAASRIQKSRLDAIDVKSGNIRNIAEYPVDVTFGDGYAYTLSGSLSRDGKSFATTVFSRKADLWMLEGFPQPHRRWF